MLRYLALFIVCVVAALAQPGLSVAYAGQLMPSASQHDQARMELAASPLGDEDCPSGSRCCSVICAPVPALLSGKASVLPRSLRSPVFRQDCLRPIMIGRDPPIPRLHML